MQTPEIEKVSVTDPPFEPLKDTQTHDPRPVTF